MPTLSLSAKWSLAAVSVTTLVLVLWLPYQFPVPPSFSDSYLFGFNNHVALLLVAGFALGVALCTRNWSPVVPVRTQDSHLSRRLLFWALSLMLLATAALSLPVVKLQGIEESVYLIDRLDFVQEGRAPGTDFEFVYGPLLLYGPAALARLLAVSAGAAYSLFWVLLNLSGVWMLFATLQGVDLPFRLRRPAFLFLLVVAFANLLSTGINYSLFRFVSPPFFALVVYRLLNRTASRWSSPLGILALTPFYALLLTISPELALSFACGLSLLLLLFFDLRPWRMWLCLLVTGAGLAVTTWAAFRLGIFATLNAFRGGGNNFPVLPAPHILLFLLVLALVSAYFFQRLRLRQANTVIVLTLASAGSVVGALGRCDPVHVFLNPLGCWIAGFVLADYVGGLGSLFVGATAGVFLLLDAPPSLYGSAANLAKAALPIIFAGEPEGGQTRLDRLIERRSAAIFGPEKAQEKLAELRFFAHHPGTPDLSRLYGLPSATVFAAPFGFAPGHSGTLHTPQADPGFYLGLQNVLTPEAVQRKITEIADHPERPLLMLSTQETSCAVDPERERQAVSGLFSYPYRAAARHPDSVLEPFCTFLRSHYAVAVPATPEHFGYALWRRLPGDR